MNRYIEPLVLFITLISIGCGNVHHPVVPASPFPRTLIFTPPATETFYCFMDGNDELCFEELGECALATRATGSNCTIKRIFRRKDPNSDHYDRCNPYVRPNDPVPPVESTEENPVFKEYF